MIDESLTLKANRFRSPACFGLWAGLRAALVRTCEGLVSIALVLAFAAPTLAAAPVKGDVSVETNEGYARLVFHFPDEVEANVKLSGSILVITFKQPVQVSTDRLSANAPEYISAARRDPDGMGIRLALAREVRVNSMAAGERLFVDLLPRTWTGKPPGLPQEVVEELARRAREAEKKERLRRQLAQSRQIATVRVRVGRQPTFTRYVFDLPSLISIAAERGKDELTLVFDAAVNFDLADALATLPPSVAAITTEVQDEATTVRFAFAAKTDVRTFREDTDYVVDVGSADLKARSEGAIGPALDKIGPRAIEAPGTRVAQSQGQVAEVVPMPRKRPDAAPARPPPANTEPVAKEASAGPVDAKKPPTQPARARESKAEKPAASAGNASSKSAPSASQQGAAKAPAGPAESTAPAQANEAGKTTRAALSEPASPGQSKEVTPKKEAAKASATPSAPTPPGQMNEASAKPSPASGASAVARPPNKVAATGPPAVAEATAPAQENKTNAAVESPASPGPAAAAAIAAANSSSAEGDSIKPMALADPDAAIKVELLRRGDSLRLVFPFRAQTPAAVFRRADTLWIVFDSGLKLDLSSLNADTSRTIRSATVTRSREGQVLRVKLERPRLTSLAAEGASWTVTIGDVVLDPTKPLTVNRNMVARRASAIIPFDDPKQLHRIFDPDVGDTLLVITALGPARGFLKTQNFVEFRALMSTHGIVLQPIADNLDVELSGDKVVIGRPSGLILSAGVARGHNGLNYRPVVFDPQLWGYDRQANFIERQRNLIWAAAQAPQTKRSAPRIDLARFYLSRDMYAEAKGVLEVAMADERPTADDATPLVLHAVANLMLDRPDEALKDLSNPLVGNQYDAALWRAVVYAKQGNWPKANEAFKKVAVLVGTLPIELQRIALKEAVRAAIEVGDLATAASRLDEFDTIGTPPEMKAAISVLAGRIAQGLGRTKDALASYRAAAESSDRPAAAEGRLREIELRYRLGDLKRPDVIAALETLTTIWRGDQTEIEAMQLLSRLYTEEGRYRDAFNIMRAALLAHPNSDLTRRIQESAAATFDSLFLGGKGDAMPAIDALSLFYDFRELTPIGRRGDEMIRRLADRLVSVDLLDQAAELLQHQVDHRLEGAGRAQVATRLAVIYLMNRKPDRALATLSSTRTAELSNELRDQRLLLEARALSDLKRHDLALEVVANMKGREAVRLRSDILWAAQRWREAAEQIELLYGDRWRQWEPLSDIERADILRAAVGYALGEDKLGLERFRDKYAAKMAESVDRHAFEVATEPLGSDGDEFSDIARRVAAVDTLDGFLRDMRARYPETGAWSASPATKDKANPESRPQPDAQAPQTPPAAPATTGSVQPRYIVRSLAGR